ncbi:MAG: GNAT family N-acetyltransferase [Planctomycetaceae bacterium]|jgi:ribosomal protein S18 acetylase RimI-like enzyme|nr:GNAT family N-acetyltransferase [Planctomycetaceae bacterium]
METKAQSSVAAYQVSIAEEDGIDSELDAALRALLCRCFPEWSSVFQECRTWHSTPPIFTLVASEHGQIIGHVAVVVRTITTTWNFRYNVASIQGVCVSPENRRSGLATEMMLTALNEIKRRGFLFAILFCKEHLVSFYTDKGWKLADDSVVMRNKDDLPISMRSNCPMYYELGDVPFPEGPLDVHSPSWE